MEAFARKRVGDPELAADLTSETFTRAWRRLNSISEQRADPVAWLMTISRNLIIDHHRNAHTRLSASVGDDAELERAGRRTTRERLISAEEVAIDGMQRTAAAHAVQGVLEELLPQQREALRSVLDGRTAPEDAARSGMALDAVKARRFRAIQAARKYFTGAGIRSRVELPDPPQRPAAARTAAYDAEVGHRLATEPAAPPAAPDSETGGTPR